MIQMADTHLSEEEIQAAMRVLRSGALRQGPECDAFENEFSAITGAKHAITCANGSASLHLAYTAVLEPGDEVLVPSFTFFATASMVIQSGMKPILCDVDPDTYLLDLTDAERRLTSKTRGISPVHLFGNACDVDKVRAFARKHGLKIIWDAAQAQGTLWKDTDVGGLSEAVCYSFYPTKNLFVGEGGMVTTPDAEIGHRIRFLRTHGQTAKYTHTMVGWNYRMTDVEAAIGRTQLKRLTSMLTARRRNARILSDGLSGMRGLKLQRVTPDSTHSWHQFCLIVEKDSFGMSRDKLMEYLKNNGVATAIHYPRTVHQQPIIEQLYGKQKLPVSEWLTSCIIALPVHHALSEDDVRYIVDTICKVATA